MCVKGAVVATDVVVVDVAVAALPTTTTTGILSLSLSLSWKVGHGQWIKGTAGRVR